VKLLFDQNLSRRLVGTLSIDYPESSHVTEVGLGTATDAEIWTYAGEHGFVIVSKDSDFRQLAFLHGPPPKAIWVRLPLPGPTGWENIRRLRDLQRSGLNIGD
jgi:predicted nuclease of predicted toxin-antitoxin system